MKLASVLALAAAASWLAACHPALTLEEAQALCNKQGGLLVVIYSQKITRTRMGPVVASPGDCVSPSKFLNKDDSSPSPAAAAPPEPAVHPPQPAP